MVIVLMEPSDEELYRRMRKGSQQAFAELYSRHEPALFRYALHMSGSRLTAEEVTHEVFVQVMSPAARFDEQRGSLEAYLYGIARNLVRAARRLGNVEEAREQAVDDDVLGVLLKNELTAALYTALEELTDRYRDAVVLCDLEEKSYEDAARLMGCPVGTVRSRLHRARMLLATRLKPLMAQANVR